MKAGQWDVLGMRLAVLLTWSEDGWVAIATDITKPQTAGGGGKGGACKTGNSTNSSNRELPISDAYVY